MSRYEDIKPKYKKILAPINFTDHSRAAFYTALGIAAQNGGETHVLHVSEPISTFDHNKAAYVKTQENIQRIEEGVKRRVDELYNEGGEGAVDRSKIHLDVRGGNASDEILKAAKEGDYDLIVLGKGPKKGWAGTTAERVLRGAPCSVFCV